MITACGPIQHPSANVQVAIQETEKVAKIGLRCGLAGGLIWFAMGTESVLRPFQDNRRETFWLLPFLLTIITLVCVHLIQRRRSRIESVGFAAVVIASALMLVGNVGLQLTVTWLEVLGAPAGPLIWLVGLLCFGIGTLKAGLLPRSVGWALIFFEPSSVLAAFMLSPIAPMLPRGAYSGNVGKGVALAILAFGLRRFRTRDANDAGTAQVS